MYMFASELKITDKYDYCACLGFIRFGTPSRRISHNKERKVCYTIYASHGDGIGGRTAGGKANGLERRSQIVPQVDVMVVGHTHTFRL